MMVIGGKMNDQLLESFDDKKLKCDDCGKYFDFQELFLENYI